MVISTGLYHLNYYPQFSFGETLLHIYPDVFTYGLIPITLVTLVAGNRMLKENLKEALMANHELDRIQILKRPGANRADRQLQSPTHSDTSEVLKIECC